MTKSMTKRLLAIFLSALMLFAMPLTVSAYSETSTAVKPTEPTRSSISGYYCGWISPSSPTCSVSLSSSGSGGVGITLDCSSSVSSAAHVTAVAYGGTQTTTFLNYKSFNTNSTTYFDEGITHYGNTTCRFDFYGLSADMYVEIYIYG